MAVIDWVQFNENFQYYDKEIISEIINIFFEEYDTRMIDLEKNIAEKDFTALAFNAHSLKSVISNYMAPQVLELTRRLEEMGKNKSDEGIDELFADLKSTTKKLMLELEEYLANSAK